MSQSKSHRDLIAPEERSGSRKSDKQFVIKFGAAFAAVIALVLVAFGVVNWFVNPLYLYRNGETGLISGLRLDFGYNSRVAKPHILSTRPPTGLIVGNSRAEFGYSPTDPIFGDRGYNAAYSGGSANEALHTFAHATAVSDLQTVIWSFDSRVLMGSMSHDRALKLPLQPYLDFPTPVSPKATMAKLVRDGNGNGSAVQHYLQKALLVSSMYQLNMSLNSLLGPSRYDGKGLLYGAYGQRDNKFNQYWIEQRGQWGMATPYLRGLAKQQFAGARDGISFRAFSVLAKGSEIAKQSGVRLAVVLEPVHAAVFAAADKRGEYDRISQAIATFARFIEAHNLDVELWDCALLNSYTTEAIPGSTAKDQMRWWWETNHFKSELGSKILSVVSGRSTEPGLCIKVDAANAAEHVAYRDSTKNLMFADGYPVLRKLFKNDPFWQAGGVSGQPASSSAATTDTPAQIPKLKP